MPSSEDISQRRLDLSPAKRALLERLTRTDTNKKTATQEITRRASQAQVPATFAQQRLWFLEQLEPNGSAASVPAHMQLTGQLDSAVLTRCLHELSARHEVLRTTFAVVDGQPIQVVAPTVRLPIPFVDLSNTTESEREASVQRLMLEETQRPFHLTTGPLVRARLLKLSDTEHMLLFVMHHTIADGWSVGILFRELVALYAAYTQGKPSPFVELPVQYADYALWQRQWLQGEVLEQQVRYWQEHLAGAPTTLDIPCDRRRPPVQTYAGAMLSYELDKSLTEQLKVLSRQEGCTLFMTLLAAFQVLLYRYTGQDDLLIGTPIANRTRTEIEGLIGLFINTLVVRTSLVGNPSFLDLLARVRENALGAYAHQDLPFEKLVEVLQPRRDVSRHPLFQVMFSSQSSLTLSRTLPHLTFKLLSTQRHTAQFDLTVSILDTEEGVLAGFEYNTDLFDQATMSRMAAHFQELLAHIVRDPYQHILDIPLLTFSERQRMLYEWNQTAAPYAFERCIPEMFEQQVAQRPDALAIRYENTQLRYAELNQRANQLAQHLRVLGVGPEVRVGICCEPSLELAIGLLAILKAGGTYIPLDPAYPQERLAFILHDAQIAVLVTQTDLQAHLPAQQISVVCLDSSTELLTQYAAENFDCGLRPENGAYVIYTSGSTGKPKGVLIPHRAVVNHNLAVIQRYGLQPTDRVLQFASISFDVAVEELFSAWLSGATVVFKPRDLSPSFQDFLRFVEQEHLTVLNLPAPYWHEWVAELPRLVEPVPASLRLLIIGSDKALPERLATWYRYAGTRVQLYNAYGPTEATITTTVYEPDMAAPPTGSSLPIGRPVANAQVYILDTRLQPVPPGVAGELYIGGAGLARGYLNRPALTAEKFIPHPFSRTPGARLYQTGDSARSLPDGTLEFLGRGDTQVKIRGFRIELGEVEAVLAQHPQVQSCIVLAREDLPGEKRLVAYLTATTWEAPSTSTLRHYLKAHIPEYMLPSTFIVLDVLPVNANGKIDWRALPSPETLRPSLEEAYIAPRSEIERTIATIWQTTLHVEHVGMRDNFFDLGGHSLLMIQVHRQLCDALQRDIPLLDLFRYASISALSEHLIGQPHAEDVTTPASKTHGRADARKEAMKRQKSIRHRP
ncbi:MAG: amino acid adenylation domain-containing protein [Chloroflexota bacterium]|nr:amino acid adenylation domain-containing protein [Chloroflexota bacterium]